MTTENAKMSEKDLLKRIAELEEAAAGHKETETALRESDARFRSVFDNAQDGFIIADAQTRKFIEVNAAVCSMLGYRHDEILALGVEDIHPKDSLPHVMDQFRKQLSKEIALANNLPMQRKDGSVFYADVHSAPLPFAGKSCIMGIFRDITERKNTEEVLQESIARYRDLTETTTDWIWEVDPNGVYTYCSPKVKEMLGYMPEEVIGKTPFYFITQDDKKRISELFHSFAQAQKPFSRLENWNLRKDGSLALMETSGVPVFNSRGQFAGYRGIDRDITERKKLETLLMQSEKLSAVGQLAAGVAHEINNPLAIILGFCQSMLAGKKEDDTVFMPLKSIERETLRCKDFVHNLLTFSRSQKNEQIEELDLNNALTTVISLVLSQSRMFKVEVAQELSRGIPKIRASKIQLQQILINLANNAIEAMPNGGTLLIRTLLSARRPGYVEIQVQDTGHGIPSGIQLKIFEPFFTTKETGKGAGMGLALAYEIIRRHEGIIEFQSAEGKGTTFTIYLPIPPKII